MSESSKERSKIRFQAESLSAPFDLDIRSEFQGKYQSIVINESFTGACLVARNEGLIKTDQEVKVKVGKMDEIIALVVWVKEIDEDIIKFGIEYAK